MSLERWQMKLTINRSLQYRLDKEEKVPSCRNVTRFQTGNFRVKLTFFIRLRVGLTKQSWRGLVSIHDVGHIVGPVIDFDIYLIMEAGKNCLDPYVAV